MKRIAAIAFEMSRLVWHAPLLLTFAGCLTGCLVIPTPHTDSGHARANVDRHTPEQFTPGRTTREEVIMALGEPDAVSRDELQLAYRSEKIVAFWVVGAYGSGKGGTIYKNRYHVFDFDPQGRFQCAKQTGQYSMVEGAHEPLLDSPALTSGDSNGVAATIAGDPVRCGYSKSFWLAGVDGYRSKGAKSMVGEPGLLLLTESNLVFVTAFQFANTEPALMLPLATVAEARVDEGSACRLVVRLKTGQVHSFRINRPGRHMGNPTKTTRK